MYSTPPTTAEKWVIELITTECPDNVTTFERVYHRETFFQLSLDVQEESEIALSAHLSKEKGRNMEAYKSFI